VEFQELTLHACFNSHAAIERNQKSKINDPLHQNPQGITGANCTNRKHQTSSNFLKEMDCLSFALEKSSPQVFGHLKIQLPLRKQ
jgi:hypothetical protein